METELKASRAKAAALVEKTREMQQDLSSVADDLKAEQEATRGKLTAFEARASDEIASQRVLYEQRLEEISRAHESQINALKAQANELSNGMRQKTAALNRAGEAQSSAIAEKDKLVCITIRVRP